jgi:hypothetical protein
VDTDAEKPMPTQPEAAALRAGGVDQRDETLDHAGQKAYSSQLRLTWYTITGMLRWY